MWRPATNKDLELYGNNYTARIISGKSVKPVIPPMEVIECANEPWF